MHLGSKDRNSWISSTIHRFRLFTMKSGIWMLSLRRPGLPVRGPTGQLFHQSLLSSCNVSTEQLIHRSSWISLRPVRNAPMPSSYGSCSKQDPGCTTLPAFLRRSYATAAEDPAEGERKIKLVLQGSFPQAVKIEVEDVSGGCGSMYQIYVEAEEFRGKKLVEQQRMVNEVLQKEIKAMHGLSLHTAVPKKPAVDAR